MMITWFKHYHGAATDAKFLAAADIAGADPLAAFATYSYALEYASEHEDRGSLAGFNPQVIASFYRRSVDEIERILQAFRDLGMIAGDRIADWAERQGCAAANKVSGLSQKQGAVRMRRWRAAKKAAPSVTSSVTSSVTVTTDKEGESENNGVSIINLESVTAREGARVHEGLSESDPDVPSGAARPLAPVFKKRDDSSGRDAPLGEPQPSENVVKLSDSAAAKNAEHEAKLKARRKAQRQQKVMRFIGATYAGEEQRRLEGMMGYDTEHDAQWWFDHLDREMKRANWDDCKNRRPAA
jgi:hypothetical protein